MTERQLGIDAFHAGRMREAVDRLSASVADHDRTVSQALGFQTYAYLGAALYALGDAAGAAAVFSAAVTLHEGASPPLDLMINLANACLASGRRSDAEQALTRALRDNPGAMEARLLLDRLHSRNEKLPITGAVLGESLQSVQRYMDTLSFSVSTRGYSPEEVRAALTQIRHYIDTLAGRLDERERTVTEQAAEIERMRQAEETLVGNMVQARQESDRLRDAVAGSAKSSLLAVNGQDISGASEEAELTPLEKLFQKKS